MPEVLKHTWLLCSAGTCQNLLFLCEQACNELAARWLSLENKPFAPKTPTQLHSSPQTRHLFKATSLCVSKDKPCKL